MAIVVITQTDGTPECSDDMVRWLPKTADVNSLAHALSTFGPGSFRSINRIRSRPLQVLRMLADGATVNEAAKLLGIAPKTAMNYLHETYQLLGVRNMTHAILAATRSDLLGYSIRLNPSSPPQVRKEV